ncbi:ERF family protein [Delftia acidovorans]|uniref:ERF family protein n=1 Tax=Delftia acidovorans TaxID=80866 RepID=UPI003D0ACBA5
MNTATEEMTLIDVPVQQQAVPAVQQGGALAPNSPAAMMMTAMAQGASLEQVEKMMDLQDRWEKKEAEKAYNAAFAKFKSEAVRIVQGRTVTDGPLKGRAYAELHDVVKAVTPALSRHGLSASWRLSKDDPQWIEITCVLKHIGGHSESVSMGGAPDTGGAKNQLQARASTKSYLERYTLKAICGVAEGGDDDDGDGGGTSDLVRGWVDYALARKGTPEFDAACKKARAEFDKSRDVANLKAFNAAVAKG